MSTDRSHVHSRFATVVWPIILVVLLVVGAAMITWFSQSPRDQVEAAPPPEMGTLEAVQSGFNWMADQAEPAVVFIEVENEVAKNEAGDSGPEMQIPDPLRDWFGRDFPMPRTPEAPRGPSMGQGSGVVIDPAGYILTNNHVVGSAAKVTVHFADGESYPAEVKGTDQLTDLAVIKIDAKRPLIAAKLGNADQCRVGSWVMAIGFPFGGHGSGGVFDEALRFQPTVTVGVISATERQLQSDLPGRPYRDLIQTDAPINPGNSGGPLVNIRAEVIGINQAIFTSGFAGGNIGVGFAIPINENTKSVIESLKGGEPVVRGQLGISVAPLTEALKTVYKADHGVFVEEVRPDSPAERGGLEPEDVIVSYHGEKVTSVEQFVTLVQETKPGTARSIDVIRDGKDEHLKVTVEALTLEAAQVTPPRAQGGKLGLTVENVPDARLEEAGLEGGVLVRGVKPMGPASRAGVQAGDIIVKINRVVIKDVDGYQKAVGNLVVGEPVVMRIWRDGRLRTAQIERLEE